GDSRMVETIVDEYAPALWRLAYRLLHDSGRAEDAVQETFGKGGRNIQMDRGDGSLLGWFQAICRRHCVDQLERRCNGEIALDVLSLQVHSDLRSGRAQGTNPLVRDLERHNTLGWEDQAILRLLIKKEIMALTPEPLRDVAILVLVRGFSR